MADVPNCPWCGASGKVTDSFGRPSVFDRPGTFVDWECKSHKPWPVGAVQSSGCKARILAQRETIRQRDAEIAELKQGGIHWWSAMRQIAEVLGCRSLNDVLPAVEELKRRVTNP